MTIVISNEVRNLLLMRFLNQEPPVKAFGRGRLRRDYIKSILGQPLRLETEYLNKKSTTEF